MALTTPLQGVLDWLLKGYPTGIPPKDYIPLLALLRRQLTEDEVRQIADEMASRANGATASDIGVSITRITDAMPTPDDIARVEAHLNEHHDWPQQPSEAS